MVHRINRLTGRYLNLIAGRERLVLVIVLLSFIASLTAATRLTLKSDLKELLPPNYESVKELNRVIERVGGIGTLVAVVESPDVESNKKFMDDLAAKLDTLPEGLVRYMNYKADDIRRFYEDHFLYYLNTADLELFYNRLKKRIDYEKFRRTPLFLELDEDETAVPGLHFDDIRKRNEKNYQAPLSTVDDYYGGEWGRLLIMMIRPYGATITIESARGLIKAVEDKVDSLDFSAYDPRTKVGFCGNVKSTIDEYETLKHDVMSTALLCILLVALAIAVFFLRVRVVFLLGAVLVIAVAWTAALTKVAIGYLNAQTAFLGSIIVGTGINYGIILMARYLEERKKRFQPHDSMKTALEATVVPTFLASATTAVSFVVLMIAHIRGLSQFGFIGAAGVMLCWAAAILVLPPMVIESEKILRLVRPRTMPPRRSAIFELLSRISSRSPVFILVFALASAALALTVVWRFAPNAIEYDFTKMRNQVSISTGTEALERRVSKLFKHSMTPSVVLVDSALEGRAVCAQVMKQNSELKPSERRVGSCHSIFDLLPAGQEAKLPIMAKLDKLLSQNGINKLSDDMREKIDRVKKSILGRELTIADLPEALTRHFEDLDGNRGAVVFINPKAGLLLSDGRNLMKFADTIRDINLPDGRTMHAVSELIVFSDLIKIIKREAPYLTLASLFCVVAFVTLMLRRMKISSIITFSLVWAVLVMIGIAAFLEIKINFFNFIVLPLTFGIGVDYGINMAMRIREEVPMEVAHAIRHTGAAVVLCSITTIIGYFVLTTANNQALATFGLTAVVGEITCVFAAIVLVPAIIVFFDRMKRRLDGQG